MTASAAAFKRHYALVHLVSTFVVIEEGRVLSISHWPKLAPFFVRRAADEALLWIEITARSP